MSKKSFSFRAFTSYILLFTFLAVLITGVVLFITPKGRVANWVDWQFLGLNKDQWASVHILSTLLFTVFGIVHLVYNIKPLLNYLKSRMSQAARVKGEMLAALLLTVVVCIGTVADVQPFKAVMDSNERIKDYWESKTKEAPSHSSR
ncbi:MAG: DUF4405 domain-containing protein [Planctomycetota bacterium]|nr:DUF4405 domain-containing protein [Planctomycetota bacterium]